MKTQVYIVESTDLNSVLQQIHTHITNNISKSDLVDKGFILDLSRTPQHISNLEHILDQLAFINNLDIVFYTTEQNQHGLFDYYTI